MAYSPSPQPSPLVASGNGMHLSRLSATPPLPQMVSKRDKKRFATLERLNDISASFTVNRDAQYRAQVNSLQLDMSYINRANPYQSKPLEDTTDMICADVTSSLLGNAHGGLRGSARMPEFETPMGLGKWSAVFAQEVNNAMEERDTQLTELANRHNLKIASLEEESRFCSKVAEEERKALSKTIRERLIQTVNQRKNRMLKEKEHLDIADTNALLFNPSQFSITNPASPGGTQNNRKTRHTRHRLEVDDLGAIGDNNKRKRKAPGDADDGSPGPLSRVVETDASYPLEKSKARAEYQQMTAPLYSVERLFTDKELNMHTQFAVQTAVHFWASKRTKLNSGNSRGVNGSISLANGDLADAEHTLHGSSTAVMGNEAELDDEDTTALAATDMDRTANQSFYATRSTRNNASNIGLPTASNLPSELAGRMSAISTIGAVMKVIRSKEDANYPPSLTEAEMDYDARRIEQAIAEEEQRPGYIDRKLVDEVCQPKTDYYADEQPAITHGLGISTASVAAATTPAGRPTYLTAGGISMSAQPSLAGYGDTGATPMSRSGSAANGGHPMKRSASGPGYGNAGGMRGTKLR